MLALFIYSLKSEASSGRQLKLKSETRTLFLAPETADQEQPSAKENAKDSTSFIHSCMHFIIIVIIIIYHYHHHVQMLIVIVNVIQGTFQMGKDYRP